MLMSRYSLLVIGILAVASVDVHAESRATVNANARGNRALDTGEYEEALKFYSEALKLAEKDDSLQYRAIAMYGLARANAHLCRVDAADQWFRDSISLRESLPDEPAIAWVTQNWLEYARFLYSRGRNNDAVSYFGRAVPVLEKMGIEEMDPIGYADMLDAYESAMLSIGMTAEAEAQAQRAAQIRQKYPDRQARFRPVPYPTHCEASS